MIIGVMIGNIGLAGELYDRKLIKSRAKRGYDANGTAIYSYRVIDEYSDDLDPEEDLGAFEVEPGIREVHSVVIIKGDVESEVEDLRIGTVRTGRSGRLRTVNNRVSIDGDVRASGNEVNIGTVNLNNRPAGQITIRNRVDVDGSFKAN